MRGARFFSGIPVHSFASLLAYTPQSKNRGKGDALKSVACSPSSLVPTCGQESEAHMPLHVRVYACVRACPRALHPGAPTRHMQMRPEV